MTHGLLDASICTQHAQHQTRKQLSSCTHTRTQTCSPPVCTERLQDEFAWVQNARRNVQRHLSEEPKPKKKQRGASKRPPKGADNRGSGKGKGGPAMAPLLWSRGLAKQRALHANAALS
eukprot:743634-Pelagomonas_calceolata.AAC.1